LPIARSQNGSLRPSACQKPTVRLRPRSCRIQPLYEGQLSGNRKPLSSDQRWGRQQNDRFVLSGPRKRTVNFRPRFGRSLSPIQLAASHLASPEIPVLHPEPVGVKVRNEYVPASGVLSGACDANPAPGYLHGIYRRDRGEAGKAHPPCRRSPAPRHVHLDGGSTGWTTSPSGCTRPPTENMPAPRMMRRYFSKTVGQTTQVRDPCLVLQRDEHHALGTSGAPTHKDNASSLDPGAVAGCHGFVAGGAASAMSGK